MGNQVPTKRCDLPTALLGYYPGYYGNSSDYYTLPNDSVTHSITDPTFLLLDSFEYEEGGRRFSTNITYTQSSVTSYLEVIKELSEPIQHRWFEVATCILCIVGIVGNILNLLVLSNKRMASDRIGRSMNVGLIALAISDMLFCVVVFPYIFIPKDMYPAPSSGAFKLIYRIYGIGCINLFMMSSTWLIMFMSISRYIGVIHPLKARSSFCTTKMPCIIALVYIASVLLTLPSFMHLSVLPCLGPGGEYLYELRSGVSDTRKEQLVFYSNWIWPIIADFFPMLLLLFCNTRLICQLQKTSKSRRTKCPGQAVKPMSNRVNITLIAVVLNLLIFVSPSEILKYVNPYEAWGPAGYVIADLCNVMQMINFSTNFFLYCAVNPKFRSAAHGLMLSICCPWKATPLSMIDRETRSTLVEQKGSWKSQYASSRVELHKTKNNGYKQVSNMVSAM